MFTEKDLISGETVLVFKDNHNIKRLYLGGAGYVHFTSASNKYECAGGKYTIEELNELYSIDQPKSNVVPLEKKVYDFVPVRVRDSKSHEWEQRQLIYVLPHLPFPYRVVNYSCNGDIGFRYCEFLNEQP